MKQLLFVPLLLVGTGFARAATPSTPIPMTLPAYQIAPRVAPKLQPFSLQDVRLLDGPFKHAQHIRCNVYWNTFSPAEFGQQQAKIAASGARTRELATRTLDEFRPNEQQSERDHALKSQNSGAGNIGGSTYRDASEGGFFEFDLKAQPNARQELLVTYWGSDSGNRDFDILVNGQKIASQTLLNNKPNEFFDVTYPIPTELTQGLLKVTIRFQAKLGARAGGVFGARMMKK